MNDERPKKIARTWIVVIPIVIVGVAVLTATVGVLGLYVFSSSAAPFTLLAHAFPFPAAYVDGQAIRYSDWSDDTRAFVALAEQGKVSIPGAVSRHDIAVNVMDRLVRNKVLDKLALERGIAVSDTEIGKEFDRVASGSENRATLEAMLKALGWSDNDVKTQIVRPYLLGQRLAERLGSVAEADQAIEDAIAASDVKILVKF